MRILFVAMPDSVHTARWIRQLAGQGWDVHLFPVYDAAPHRDLTDVTLHTFSTARTAGMNPSMRLAGPYPLRKGGYRAQLWAQKLFPERMSGPARLASVVERLKPDIVNSLEMQHGAYLTLAAKQIIGDAFPPWMMNCWGNDIYLFGRLAEHAPKIKTALAACDYFTADCNRDIALARAFGFAGETFPALPGAGGFDIELAKELRPPGLTSARRTIALKGYQNWYGRALTGLRAVELCADVLKDYSVTLYFPNDDVKLAAELMSQRTGIEVEIFPHASYEDSLRMHSRARVSLGVSISDGLPLSAMEAALMGSFPVQTDTSCVGEWLRDGEGTLLVPSDDAEAIARALRRALTDDDLVDRAAELNFRYISEHLSLEAVRPQVLAMYEKIDAASERRK
ncbi:MAG: glycosyltransferase family 4 protein [Pyrinomonadaceae bacterium]